MKVVSSGLSGWFDDTANRPRATSLSTCLHPFIRFFAMAPAQIPALGRASPDKGNEINA